MALTTSTAATAAASGAQAQPSSRSAGTFASSFDGFLKLLTAQLENQDPLSPLDATQFTSQLVQFSTVEQAIRTNDQLGSLTRLIEGNTLTSALGFIGTDVEFAADQVRLGAEDGAVVDYQLPEAAADVTVTIRDQRGRVVHQGPAPAGAGAQRYAWDGRDAEGARAPEGLYRVELRAVDAEGAAVAATRTTRGTVDGVETGASGGLQLSVGGVPVPLASVKAVHRPAEAAIQAPAA